MIVFEVCTRAELLLKDTGSAFPYNIMPQCIAVIPWFNLTTFDELSLKACSSLEGSVVVSDNSCTVPTLLFPVCATRCRTNVPAYNQRTTSLDSGRVGGRNNLSL